jgi:hypothetical protein
VERERERERKREEERERDVTYVAVLVQKRVEVGQLELKLHLLLPSTPHTSTAHVLCAASVCMDTNPYNCTFGLVPNVHLWLHLW